MLNTLLNNHGRFPVGIGPALCGRFLAMLLGIGVALGADVSETADVSHLKGMSLDELLAVSVTSLSKKEEPLLTAASAIQVLTGDDIRRSGASSIPDALQLASNLQVAQLNSREWAITSRGFNATTANNLLVLIDGRSVYTPLFSGVFWDSQDTLLEDIDRIEIISGPGGTLWGANAVNGVINIITKSARDTQGLMVTGGGGTVLNGFGAVRYGGQLGEKAHYRAYLKHFERDGSRLPNGADAGDAVGMTQGGFRSDWETRGANFFTLQGDLYDGSIEQRTGADIELDGGNIGGDWRHEFSDDSTMNLQLYYDHTHRNIPNLFREDLDTVDVQFEHRFLATERNNVIWGADYRLHDDHVGNSTVLAFLPARLTTHLFSGFIQNEIMLIEDTLDLTLGTKLEHNDFSGFEHQPSGRIRYRLTKRQTLWSAVSRPVRTPSRIDRDFFVPPPFNLAGGPGFESEKLIAYEIGYRIQPIEAVFLAVSGFYNDYQDLRSLENSTPKVLANGLEGETFGAELTGTWQAAPWWRMSAGYTFLQMNLHTKPGSTDLSSESQEGDSPHHQIVFRSSVDILDRVEWDATVRFIDNLPNQGVPSYWSLDMRLAYSPRDDLEFAVVGQNLLDNQHPEFGGPASRREIQRGVYGKVTWRF